MPEAVSIEQFIGAQVPVIDVRSPGEFAQGHIPGAINLPLFSNAERAEVGTLYKQDGPEAALVLGLRFVGPKLADLVLQAKAAAPQGRVAVHCWRGGQRSASVAWLLEKAAGMQVLTLRNGYKAFRRSVLNSFNRQQPLRILGGYTGTGKTAILRLLREQGAQTVDLEGLARHKGSSYGGIGEGPQPSNEHFENLLWEAFQKWDPAKPVWLEDESQNIGRAKVPDALFARMRTAPVYFVDMPRPQRVAHLVEVYGAFPKAELAAATERIQKRLGPQHAQSALAALNEGRLDEVATITLAYYDKTYARGLAARDPSLIRSVDGTGKSPAALAKILMEP